MKRADGDSDDAGHQHAVAGEQQVGILVRVPSAYLPQRSTECASPYIAPSPVRV